jgi:large subunit ribosomal protein L7A
MALDAMKGSDRVIGLKQVTKAVHKDNVSKVFTAEDADERVIAPIRELCASRGIPVETVKTMMELGKACNIEVGAAAAAVLK